MKLSECVYIKANGDHCHVSATVWYKGKHYCLRHAKRLVLLNPAGTNQRNERRETAMEKLIITSADVKDGAYIKGVLEFEGHVELAEGLGWVKFVSLIAKGYIWAKAGTGIEAGEGIKAGTGIEAGEGIKAGTGIEAGEGIKAGANISVRLRIFAGLLIYRKPTPDEMSVKCRRLESGEVAYGTLIEMQKGGK